MKPFGPFGLFSRLRGGKLIANRKPVRQAYDKIDEDDTFVPTPISFPK